MTRIVAAPERSRARISTAEFERMCDADVFDDGKIELVDGELERMPPPHRAHSLLQGSIYAQLVALFGAERVCLEIAVDLGDDTVVGCDIVLLRAAMVENRKLRADEVQLAIEIAETTQRRDTGIKLAKYAGARVAHYWVVDGARAVTHVYDQPRDADYVGIELKHFGEPLAVPGTDATITLDVRPR